MYNCKYLINTDNKHIFHLLALLVDLESFVFDQTSKDKKFYEGKIIIAPPSALKDRWSRRFPNPIICMASGWMTVKQRAKQQGIELPLVISDHSDWNELLDTIKKSKAKNILITHGQEDALVYYCKKQNLVSKPLSIQGRSDEEIE